MQFQQNFCILLKEREARWHLWSPHGLSHDMLFPVHMLFGLESKHRVTLKTCSRKRIIIDLLLMVLTGGWVLKQLLCLILGVVSPWLSGALSLQSVMKKFSIHLIWAFVQSMNSRVRMPFFLQCNCMLTGSSDWLVYSSNWWLHVWCLQHSSASALAVLGRLMIASP